MRRDKTRIIISSLIIIVILLIGFIGFYFGLKPLYNDFINKKQAEAYIGGQADLMNAILAQIQQTGYVQIPLANNQSVILVPYNPEASENNNLK